MADAPQMAAKEIREALTKEVVKKKFDFIVVNFANPDVVGHGGRIDAAVTACEIVDQHLAKLLPELEKNGYDWILTSDHGNAEEMYYPGTTKICPSHTTNQVQTFAHSSAISQKVLDGCTGLKDIAPLSLKILGLPVPPQMK